MKRVRGIYGREAGWEGVREGEKEGGMKGWRDEGVEG
jgi:hypothetical protein